MVLRGDNVSIVNCSVSNHGALGVSLHGIGNAIRDSRIHSVGCAGLAIRTGERNASLIRGGSIVKDNVLHHFSTWKHMYQPGIAFDSVGSDFIGNTVHTAPHSGMLGRANDCRFDSNNFTQLCTESGDAGAWYLLP